MLITIRDSKQVWASPDGKIKIWDIKDAEGNTWQTRSESIANALNQALELTTTVSQTGKTYLVRPPREGYAPGGPAQVPAPAPTQATGAPGPVGTSQAIQRLENVTTRLEQALQRLEGRDRLPSEGDIAAAAQMFGGDIIDDLP